MADNVTDPEESTVPATGLDIRLFGQFAAFVDGVPLPKMRSRRETYLLALLILKSPGGSVERGYFAGWLWPENDEAGALSNLRRSLRLLRLALGPESRRILSPTPRSLRFDLTGVRCDVFAFDEAIQNRDDVSLRRAVELYRGLLVEGCFEDWIAPERQAREQAVLGALTTLVTRNLESGGNADAEGYLRRILQMDPLRESALRTLMETLAAQGNEVAAGEEYRKFRRRLWSALNTEPSAETVQLSRSIQEKRGRRSAVPEQIVRDAATVGTQKRPSNLPAALTPLIGREAERQAVLERLGAYRLVTLTGIGGIGKTRLSVDVAGTLRADYADGVFFVDLTPLSDGGPLAGVLLRTLGGRERVGENHATTLEMFLQSRHLLLVLDNCEHLLADCARIAHRLLIGCPNLTILATSREPLRLDEETVFRVPSLELASSSRLFSERARQANDSFQSTPAISLAIESICAHLDGVPLAIELTAARTRGISISRIADNVDGIFRLLNMAYSSVDRRHQTMQSTLDWSFALLSEDERRLMARLSIFAGGWTLESARAVCGDALLTETDVLDNLLSMVDKSMIIYREEADGSGRYRFLETTRVYAAEQLAADARDSLAYRHAAHFLQAAETARKSLSGPNEPQELARLELELPNYRAALNWCLGTAYLGGKPDLEEDRRAPGILAMQLSVALLRLWWIRGRFAEGRSFLERALERNIGGSNLELHSLTCNALALLHDQQGDTLAAMQYSQKALAIEQTLGNTRGIARALHNIASAQRLLGDLEGARENLVLAVKLFREIGEETRADINTRIIQSIDSEMAKDDDALIRVTRENLTLSERAGDRDAMTRALDELGSISLRQNRLAQACAFFRQSVEISHTHGYIIRVPEGLENLGAVLARLGRPVEMARTYGAAEALREKMQWPMVPGTRELYDSHCEEARSALGDAAFDMAFAQGGELTAEQAIAYAVESAERPAPSLYVPQVGSSGRVPALQRVRTVAAARRRGSRRLRFR